MLLIARANYACALHSIGLVSHLTPHAIKASHQYAPSLTNHFTTPRNMDHPS
jgi:hypothetical protein